jgi:hypothetical protein
MVGGRLKISKVIKQLKIWISRKLLNCYLPDCATILKIIAANNLTSAVSSVIGQFDFTQSRKGFHNDARFFKSRISLRLGLKTLRLCVKYGKMTHYQIL